LAEGGRDVLVYTTISGAVGALIPFISMDDIDFMQTLEMVSQAVLPKGRDCGRRSMWSGLTAAHALTEHLARWP
jgi:hypothetical protein